ncbi:TMEM175 family protein, partial [Natronococcus sp. A-GB7]|uniref:TMEM175 family protein n=1 Tax=Natronococcus sp. A-GB7 TaxID=3037649 RepID=UPI00241ECBA8
MASRRRRSRHTIRYSDTNRSYKHLKNRNSLPEGSYGRESEWFSRLLSLSNGVFGISLTLLVLSIAVPATTPSGNLDQALLELLPNAIAFALTVFIVVLYWHNHNELFESFRGIDL